MRSGMSRFSKEEAGSGKHSRERNRVRKDVLQTGSRLGKTLPNEEVRLGTCSRRRKTFRNEEAGSGRRSGMRKQVQEDVLE